MYAAVNEMFPHSQIQEFLDDGHQQSYLQFLEDEFLSTVHSSIFMNGCQASNHEDYHLGFLADSSGDNILASSIPSNYNFGDEEYFFQAQEPIPEEPLLPLDWKMETLSVISGLEDITYNEIMEASETSSLGTEPSQNEIYCQLEKELIGSPTTEKPSELLNVKFPTFKEEDTQKPEKEERPADEGALQKSISSRCFTLLGENKGFPEGGNLPGYEMDMGAAFRMRRAYSDGDIKTLRSKMLQLDAMAFPPHLKPCMLSMESFRSAERLQKLFRYRKKRSRRNFDRKIKYACRKALADSQPRVRGRFARTEENETIKHQK